MRIQSLFLTCCFVAGSLLPATALTDASPRVQRKEVGIALSGGSALGLAHIGVIRYFEEHHIPIDKIGGTSMGGLVGGLYAAGMDSSQLTAVVEQADWKALLNPSAPYADQPIVDKQKWARTFGTMTLRFGKGFSLPSGLNSGEALSLLLSHLTLGYSSVSDFDELPTPFRCVATDLVSGDAVVLKKGSLPVAMRATMSLPGIFTPVKLDQMVLVDGGVLDNIPVDAVREMGAQTVIAIALETPKPKPEQFNSLSGVLRQTVSLAIVKNEQRSLAKADIVISVAAAKFSATDYQRWREIIEAGYQAAQAHAADLAQFELSPEEWNEYLAQRRDRMRPSERSGRVLAVSSPSASFQKNAKVELDHKLANKVVTEHELETVLSGMVAATAVPGAAYAWQQGGAPEGGYTVKFSERPNDEVLVRVSGLYAVSPGEPTRFGVKLSTITIPKSAYKTRILATYNLGYDPGVQAEIFKPLGSSEFFVAPQFIIDRTHFNSYTGSARQSDTRDRFGGAVYLGAGTWRFAQLRLGAQAGHDSYDRTVVVDGVASRSGGFTIPEARWIVDTQDSGGLPTHGMKAEGSAGYVFRQTQDHAFFQNEFSTFQPIRSGITLFALNHVATSFGQKLGYFDQFMAGGQNDMAAFRYQEFHANTLATAGSGLIFYGQAIPHVSAHPGLAVWYEAGRFDMGYRGWTTHQSTSLGVFFPTQIGATGLQLNFDEAGRARFRLMLGSF